MKVCVLQPSYARSALGHAAYDPPREIASLIPEHEVTTVLLDKATVYRQLRELKRQGFDIFVNLCEGHLDWDVPSIDVIHALEFLDLPHTGPSAVLYEPRKEKIKLVAWYAGVETPPHVVARTLHDVGEAATSLRFPVFVKPNEGGDSVGIDDASRCESPDALLAKAGALLAEHEAILVEEFVPGREFSVLVAADPANPAVPLAFRPVEFRFPDGVAFKTYDLKNTAYHPECNVPCTDQALDAALREAARKIFVTFGGVGYCRMDFRLGPDGQPMVLDVNFTCSVFYPEGYYGTADYILAHDGFGAAAFLRHIIAEGLTRHRAKRTAYRLRRRGLNGWGIEAARRIATGEVIFRGEERSQRIVTRRHVAESWSAEDRRTFDRYAYPLSDEVFMIWSNEPSDWAPQNHCCFPNTAFRGLDVIALRDIAEGEELTVDYATFCNEGMESFRATCSKPGCRGMIHGTPGTSVDAREKAATGTRSKVTGAL